MAGRQQHGARTSVYGRRMHPVPASTDGVGADMLNSTAAAKQHSVACAEESSEVAGL